MRRARWLRNLGVLSLCSILILGAYGQEEPRSIADPRISQQTTWPSPTIDLAAFDRTVAEIKMKQPNISERVLAEDVLMIQASLPQITIAFWRVGLTDEDALWASLKGWKTARLESPLRLNPNKALESSSFIRHVTNEVRPTIVRWHIQAEKPEIPKQVLQKDLKLIEASQDEIASSFVKLGWTSADAREASLAAWKAVRLESPLKPNDMMDGPSFIALATDHMGAVVFVSEPDQAEVYMGSRKIGTTNKEKKAPLLWFQDGEKVTVRFTKPQFISEQRECIAKGREAIECKAELKHNQ